MTAFNALSSPLKILMTTDTVGGVWTYTMELCKALKSFRAYIYLVTLGDYLQAFQRKELNELDNVVLCETNYPLEWMHQPWEQIDKSFAFLHSLERTLQPDIIHLNNYAYGCLEWHAPVVITTHSDVYSWWLAVKKECPPAEWKKYYQTVSRGLALADQLIAPSRYMKDAVGFIYKTNTPSTVIYNARSREYFFPAPKDGSVMAAGRIWDEGKNISLLEKAAAAINAPLIIAGQRKNPYDDSLPAGNIRYTGKLSTKEVARKLSAASIYALPAKYEPFGLSILEAALSGCALVLGNIPSLKEIWADNALYVDTDCPEELADKINELLNNRKLLDSMASRAWQHAYRYNTQTMAIQYMQVYRQLIHYKKQITQRNKLYEF